MRTIQRRTFMKGSLAAAWAAAHSRAQAADAQTADAASPASVTLTPPMLQIPAPTSMGVAWGVATLSTGFVDLGTKADLSDARRIFAGDGGLRALDSAALAVRLTGLTPDTTYHYRTGTIPVDFRGAYKILPGEATLSEAHTFRTPGPASPSTFAVINDTHENHPAIARLAAKIDTFGPAVTVWNGDTCNHLDQMPTMIQTLLNPGKCGLAVSRPVLFTAGNHDYRGALARELPRLLLTREPTERESPYWTLGRNYALRQGDLALLGLDTGEDKPDWRGEWGGLAQFGPYRELQARWLADALERPEIKTAPFAVAFCHIPLFDDSPKANPGDLAEGYASWQRQCHDLWSPLFERHGVQLVIAAHTHKFRFDAPRAGRAWAQLVAGSGCDTKPGRELTVIEGKASGRRLTLKVHELNAGAVLGEFTFEARKERT